METIYKYSDANELYEFFEQLGEGGFSHCFRARFIPTNEIMAVKILKTEKSTDSII